jgi:hypothetical protein
MTVLRDLQFAINSIITFRNLHPLVYKAPSSGLFSCHALTVLGGGQREEDRAIAASNRDGDEYIGDEDEDDDDDDEEEEEEEEEELVATF